MAKKSSGSARNRADFSVDSTEFETVDGVVRSKKKENRRHSLSSEATPKAYHDTNTTMDRNTNVASAVLNKVIDVSGSHVHSFSEGFNESSLSSVSGLEGLGDDSLSGDDNMKHQKRLVDNAEELQRLTDQYGVEDDDMSHDSMNVKNLSTISRGESGATLQRMSSGGDGSIPLCYSFSSEDSIYANSKGKTISESELDKLSDDSVSNPNPLRWKIPSSSSDSGTSSKKGVSSTSSSSSSSTSVEHATTLRDEKGPHAMSPVDCGDLMVSSVESTSEKNITIKSESSVASSIKSHERTSNDENVDAQDDQEQKSMTMRKDGESARILMSPEDETEQLNNSSTDVGNGLFPSPVVTDANLLSEEENIILTDRGDSNVNEDDTSEITMEWESMVHKLEVYSSNNPVPDLRDLNDSPFSSVASSTMFVSDSDPQLTESFGEKYFSNEGGTTGTRMLAESSDDNEFRMSIHSSSTITESEGRRSKVQLTSYRSVAPSSALTSEHKISDFIRKYQLQDVISDNLSESSSTIPSVVPSTIAQSDQSFKVSTIASEQSARLSKKTSVGDFGSHISGELSTGSDTFNLRLSLMSDSSSDNVNNKGGNQSDIALSSTGETTTSVPAEVTATVRTSRAMGIDPRKNSSWLQEPSFSVASSSSSSSEDWKANIVTSNLSNTNESAIQRQTILQPRVDGAQQRQSVLADMNIFFSDSESDVEKEGTLEPSEALAERKLSEVVSDNEGFLGDLSDDSVSNWRQSMMLSKSEDEDSTDRFLATWNKPESNRQKTTAAAASTSSGQGFLESSGSSSSFDVDHVLSLQQIITANEREKKSGSDNSGIVGYSDEKDDSGETSLGDLLGFNDNSSLSNSQYNNS